MVTGHEPPDPVEEVRRFQDTYVNYYKRWTMTESIPEGVTLETPKEHPIDVADLPDALGAEIEAFEKRHPDEQLTLVKRMRTVNGDPVLVIEDATDLPDEESLVAFSLTQTVISIEETKVVTDLVVGRRE